MVLDVSDPLLKVPEAQKTKDFYNWIMKLPEKETPVWSGLPLNAERVLLEKKGQYTLSTLWKIQDLNEEEITDIRPEYKRVGYRRTSVGPSVKWMAEMGDRAGKYLQI